MLGEGVRTVTVRKAALWHLRGYIVGFLLSSYELERLKNAERASELWCIYKGVGINVQIAHGPFPLTFTVRGKSRLDCKVGLQ